MTAKSNGHLNDLDVANCRRNYTREGAHGGTRPEGHFGMGWGHGMLMICPKYLPDAGDFG